MVLFRRMPPSRRNEFAYSKIEKDVRSSAHPYSVFRPSDNTVVDRYAHVSRSISRTGRHRSVHLRFLKKFSSYTGSDAFVRRGQKTDRLCIGSIKWTTGMLFSNRIREENKFALGYIYVHIKKKNSPVRSGAGTNHTYKSIWFVWEHTGVFSGISLRMPDNHLTACNPRRYCVHSRFFETGSVTKNSRSLNIFG